jgi:hypothetical protein
MVGPFPNLETADVLSNDIMASSRISPESLIIVWQL